MKEQTFTVTGMKCVNCKARVENTINALDGVDKAEVSLENSNVNVTYDETLVSPQAMKEAVDDLGRFEIKKEEASSSGVRRIKAVLIHD